MLLAPEASGIQGMRRQLPKGTIQYNYHKTRFIGATNVQKIPLLTILIDDDNF